jgi:predicted Zn-dependent peptidase
MILNGIDGPMNTSDVVRGVIVEGLPWDSFSEMVDTIREITPEQVQILAQRYLQPTDFWNVTVG